jgi:hypothetical protein
MFAANSTAASSSNEPTAILQIKPGQEYTKPKLNQSTSHKRVGEGQYIYIYASFCQTQWDR